MASVEKRLLVGSRLQERGQEAPSAVQIWQIWRFGAMVSIGEMCGPGVGMATCPLEQPPVFLARVRCGNALSSRFAINQKVWTHPKIYRADYQPPGSGA